MHFVGPGVKQTGADARIGYGGFVLVSFCYLVLRRLLQLAALRVRSNDFKELEIVVLRHELAILRRRRKRNGLSVS